MNAYRNNNHADLFNAKKCVDMYISGKDKIPE